MKTVNIEVPLDMMISQVETIISPDVPNRRLIAETIVLSLEDCNKLQFLNMAMNGVRPTVKVNIFDAVDVSTSVWKGDSFQPIGKCIVIDTNPYGIYKVHVSFQNKDHMGNLVNETRWVSESDIINILTPDPEWHS